MGFCALNPTAFTSMQRTPIMLAARWGHVEIINVRTAFPKVTQRELAMQARPTLNLHLGTIPVLGLDQRKTETSVAEWV